MILFFMLDMASTQFSPSPQAGLRRRGGRKKKNNG